MNLSRTIVETGNNKLLISSKEPYLIISFVEKVCKIFKDYDYKMCVDTEDFLELYHRGDIFSSTPMILFLWDITPDGMKEIYPLLSLPTKDILIFAERKILSKSKTYTNFKSECSYTKLEELDEKSCLRWVSSRLSDKSLKYDRDLPKILIEKKSNNMYAIDSEIRKLEVVCGDKEIDKFSFRYIADSSDARIFDFMESLFHKRQEKALQEFYKFSEDYYIKLIFMIIGNLEKTYRIAVYKSQKRTAEEIAELTGINSFIIKTKYLTILSVYNKIKILKLIDLFNDLDYNLRTSSLSKKLIFEAYLLKVFSI